MIYFEKFTQIADRTPQSLHLPKTGGVKPTMKNRLLGE